jgi:hypothetical protein
MNPMTMRALRLLTVLFFFCAFLFTSCKSETEDFQTESLSDYLPLQTGKYITYRLDSTVFTNFGRNTEVHSFEEKHVVDSKITDGIGRPSYRIFRFIRPVNSTGPWTSAGTYFITPNDKTYELVENNLRFVKLALPVKQDFSWKGNEFLPDQPYHPAFGFSNDQGMKYWDYTYDTLNTSINLNGTLYKNVLNVTAANDIRVADTIEVVANKGRISGEKQTVFLRGLSTDTIVITADAPTHSGNKVFVYNHTNQPAMLEKIIIPSDAGKSFEYINSKWTFGYVNDMLVRKDTLYLDLPYGAKDLSQDKYAKGIGLVYQQYAMWEFLANTSIAGDGYKNGFEVKRSMIDHN